MGVRGPFLYPVPDLPVVAGSRTPLSFNAVKPPLPAKRLILTSETMRRPSTEHDAARWPPPPCRPPRPTSVLLAIAVPARLRREQRGVRPAPPRGTPPALPVHDAARWEQHLLKLLLDHGAHTGVPATRRPRPLPGARREAPREAGGRHDHRLEADQDEPEGRVTPTLEEDPCAATRNHGTTETRA